MCTSELLLLEVLGATWRCIFFRTRCFLFFYCNCTIKHALSNHNNICFCVCCCAVSILISNYTIYGRKYCLSKGPSCYLRRIWRVNCACVYQRVSSADEQMFMLMRGALGTCRLRSRWDEIGMAFSALQSRLLWVARCRQTRVSVQSRGGVNERLKDEWVPVEELVFTLNISSLFMTNPPRRFARNSQVALIQWHAGSQQRITSRQLVAQDGV